jgi:glycosyltransferase involved in cell wall biosynthesis
MEENSLRNPTVSFVVPCYKLAHLLPECINSILSQAFQDFEVLIMDDCSPDNTADAARSFRDSRVKHIRNDTNLGHLRNYNKGISLASGKYVWLISADDYLLRNYILEKYVNFLDGHSEVGYTFCPGEGVGSGASIEWKEWASYGQSKYGKSDRIIKGHVLLKELVRGNSIVAASVLVRRECYEKVSLFPLNLPWAGDWYLWCVFAMHYDVGYFAEPMVCYREHELSMTTKLWREQAGGCCDEEVTIPWAIKRKADALSFDDISKACLDAIATIYAKSVVTERFQMARPAVDLEQVENSLRTNCISDTERNWIRARVFAGMASQYYWRGERILAKQFYIDSLKMDPWMMNVYTKRLLLSLGEPGDFIWKWLKACT